MESIQVDLLSQTTVIVLDTATGVQVVFHLALTIVTCATCLAADLCTNMIVGGTRILCFQHFAITLGQQIFTLLGRLFTDQMAFLFHTLTVFDGEESDRLIEQAVAVGTSGSSYMRRSTSDVCVDFIWHEWPTRALAGIVRLTDQIVFQFSDPSSFTQTNVAGDSVRWTTTQGGCLGLPGQALAFLLIMLYSFGNSVACFQVTLAGIIFHLLLADHWMTLNHHRGLFHANLISSLVDAWSSFISYCLHDFILALFLGGRWTFTQSLFLSHNAMTSAGNTLIELRPLNLVEIIASANVTITQSNFAVLHTFRLMQVLFFIVNTTSFERVESLTILDGDQLARVIFTIHVGEGTTMWAAAILMAYNPLN